MRELTTRRTDLMDTSDWAHREMLRRLRELTPEQRYKMLVDRMDFGFRLHKDAMRRIAEERKSYDAKQ